MKHLIGILLMLCLLVCAVTVVSAAEIDKVELNGVPESITVGGTASKDGITVPENVPYEIQRIEWYVYNYEQEGFFSFDGTFETGKVYQLAVYLSSSSNALEYGLPVYVNGQPAKDYSRYNSDSMAVRASFLLGIETVSNIEILEIPEINVGDATGFDGVQLPENAPYQLGDGTRWLRFTGDYMDTYREATFIAGSYGMELEFVPKPGYWLPPDTTVTYGNDVLDPSYDGKHVSVNFHYDLTEKVDTVSVTLTKPEKGATVDNTFTVPENAKYTVTGAWYCDTDGQDATIFENGKHYTLKLRIDLAPEAKFTEDPVALVNGEPAEEAAFYEYHGYIYVRADFTTPITAVDMPAFPQVQVGDTAEAVMQSYETYTVIGQWVAIDGDSASPFNSTFEDGKVYALMMIAQPAAGYIIPDDVKITVGGEPYTGVKQVYENSAMVVKTYPFGLTKIKSIELTTSKVDADKTIGEINAARGANFTIKTAYWGESSTGLLEDVDYPEGDTFQKGKYYAVGVMLQADEGYYFADDAVVKLNGKTLPLYESSMILGNMAQIAADVGRVPPSTGSNPPTGDNTPVVLLTVLAMASLGAMAALTVGKKQVR